MRSKFSVFKRDRSAASICGTEPDLMKPRSKSSEKRGGLSRRSGIRRRRSAQTVGGWLKRRAPLRQADIERKTKKTARPMQRNRKSEPPLLTFRRILVPIDFSTESTWALKAAVKLVSTDEQSLLMVHVVGPIYDLRDFGYGPVQQRRPNKGLMRHARQKLRALGRRHVGEKTEWRCVVRSGTAPKQILKTAEEFRADVVVMPTRGLSHAPPNEVGSTAERVVRYAPCPVLVLPKKTPRRR